jgi:hypothetical protein
MVDQYASILNRADWTAVAEDRMPITPKTAASHTSAIFTKMQITDWCEAVVLGPRRGP